MGRRSRRTDRSEETESSAATSGTESPARTNRLMEEVCERENLKEHGDRLETSFALDAKGGSGLR
jgi:hypothetical protein